MNEIKSYLLINGFFVACLYLGMELEIGFFTFAGILLCLIYIVSGFWIVYDKEQFKKIKKRKTLSILVDLVFDSCVAIFLAFHSYAFLATLYLLVGILLLVEKIKNKNVSQED